MAKQWKKGDAVWCLPMFTYHWLKGVVVGPSSSRPQVEYVTVHGISTTDLRRRDPAKDGKDKPTVESEANAR